MHRIGVSSWLESSILRMRRGLRGFCERYSGHTRSEMTGLLIIPRQVVLTWQGMFKWLRKHPGQNMQLPDASFEASRELRFYHLQHYEHRATEKHSRDARAS